MVSIYDRLMDLIFPPPPRCKLCHQPVRSRGMAGICQRCLERLPIIAGPICQVCGKPLRLKMSVSATCPECKRGGRHFYERALAVGLYEGPIRDFIHRLKYYGERGLAEPLGSLMAARMRVERDFLKVQVVVPVPISERKERERGFNQSRLLAEVLCDTLKKPLLVSSLKRVRDTPSQSGLSRQERIKNLRGAFQVIGPGQISGMEVLLVDDVYTTGSTVDECARALLRAGALKVYVLTFAIGVLDSDWGVDSVP